MGTATHQTTNSPFKRTKGARASRFAALLSLIAVAGAAPVLFEIPSDNASLSFYRFMEQTGTELKFTQSEMLNVRTRAVAGTQEPKRALEAMLEGTGYTFVESSAGKYSVVRINQGEAVAELEMVNVSTTRAKPFVDGNMDIPRTTNDVQPYTIFTSAAIEQSGAASIEDYLKQRLTMNTVSISNGQNAVAQTGNTSTINLRGLGSDKTLILVDGRRMPNITIAKSNIASSQQADVNGIPISAIDRIEILPTSAAGIYGANAIGGVINIVTKKQYNGGEIIASYDNTWDTDAPRRNLSFNYGFSLEGGKTQVRFSASWSDSSSLLLQDRLGVFRENFAKVLKNNPAIYYSSYSPFLGSTPNILTTSATTLTLKNGTVIPSNVTHVGANITPSSSKADLYASLVANAGSYDFTLPTSTQTPTGLLRPYGVEPKSKAYSASIRRQMTPWLELFAEGSYDDTYTWSIYNPIAASFFVSASAPSNPFNQSVSVRVADSTTAANTTDSSNLRAVIGARAKLPLGWDGTFDYSYARNNFEYFYSLPNFTAINADISSGALNPFVNTSLYPLGLGKYLYSETSRGESAQHSFDVRGSGPLPSLPWGKPILTVGLEHRIYKTGDNIYRSNSPSYPYIIHYFPKQSDTDSIYGETLLPLVKSGRYTALHSLELQAAGRIEAYKVDTGSNYFKEYTTSPALSAYSSPTVGGKPYFSEAEYSSKNYTVGVKYQPVRDISVRVSKGTAFVTPSPSQLVKNPEQSTTTTTIMDPKTGKSTAVYTLSGGNPDLVPQNSKSINAGIIWEPTWPSLIGLRLNAEFFKTQQFNYISSLSAQQIVDQESLYPSRVTRDANGVITLVDTSYLNLYERNNEGFDFNVAYYRKTGIGTLGIESWHSLATHLQTQYSKTSPMLDAVDFPSEGGAAKYKSNLTLSWNLRGWNASWTARYFSPYKQYGASGGPYSTQYLKGSSYYYYVQAQGAERIPSQTYHDAFISYNFGYRSAGSGERLSKAVNGLLSGVTVQFGVRNVFGKVPPFDAFYDTTYYISPYGDVRLRSYWVTLKKSF